MLAGMVIGYPSGFVSMTTFLSILLLSQRSNNCFTLQVKPIFVSENFPKRQLSLKERTFRVQSLGAFSSLHTGSSTGFSGPVGLGKFGVLFADVRCEVLNIVGFAVKIAVNLVDA
jgi:hypothetical protein